MALSTDLVTVEDDELADRLVEALRRDWPEHFFAYEDEGARFAVYVRGTPPYETRVQMLSKARALVSAAATR